MNKKISLAILVSLLVIVIIIVIQINAVMLSKSGRGTIKSDFNFSNPAAIRFYNSLETRTGLLSVVPNSSSIYVADDQQLDYAALMKLGDLSLANEINRTMLRSYGGLLGSYNPTNCTLGYWNGVDVVIGKFFPTPCNGLIWNLHSGNQSTLCNSTLTNSTGYGVLATLWTGPMGSDYINYTDLDLYYSLSELHYGNYSNAVVAFEKANNPWNGEGFADEPYSHSGEYDSYKLALDLIVFKALMSNSHTESSIASYDSTLNQVQSVMSKLQGSQGGVITNYQFANDAIEIPPNTFENGETTSLFVLAE